MSHLLTYEQIQELTISELINLLYNSHKILVSELKLIDLFDDNRSVTGVYVFFDENEVPLYVGKASSRAFLERMGGHFDTRPFSYMNSMLFKLTGIKNKSETPESEFIVAFKKAYKYGLVFAALPVKGQICRLESILRKEMNPLLNPGRTRLKYTLDEKVKDI